MKKILEILRPKFKVLIPLLILELILLNILANFEGVNSKKAAEAFSKYQEESSEESAAEWRKESSKVRLLNNSIDGALILLALADGILILYVVRKTLKRT